MVASVSFVIVKRCKYDVKEKSVSKDKRDRALMIENVSCSDSDGGRTNIDREVDKRLIYLRYRSSPARFGTIQLEKNRCYLNMK